MTAKELTCADSRGQRNRRTEQCPISVTYPYHKMNVLKYVERPFYIHLRSQRRGHVLSEEKGNIKAVVMMHALRNQVSITQPLEVGTEVAFLKNRCNCSEMPCKTCCPNIHTEDQKVL
jgi:hypothetical protein